MDVREFEKMGKESIAVSMTREEFTKEIIAEIMKDEMVEETHKLMPALTIYTLVVMEKTWDLLEKHSRMEQIRDIVTATKKED